MSLRGAVSVLHRGPAFLFKLPTQGYRRLDLSPAASALHEGQGEGKWASDVSHAGVGTGIVRPPNTSSKHVLAGMELLGSDTGPFPCL